MSRQDVRRQDVRRQDGAADAPDAEPAHVASLPTRDRARGAVYLGGGILPRIGDMLEGSGFRGRFEAKPPLEDYLRAVPTTLIVHPGPALTGAIERLAQSLDALEPA